jgi:hypothetical protein
MTNGPGSLCAAVTSDPTPQPGQGNRSSGNFSTQGCGGNGYVWSCGSGIRFDVMEDRSLAQDPILTAA